MKVILIGAALFLSLAANAILGGSYYNLKKHTADDRLIERFSSYEDFAARAYGSPLPWLYPSERLIAGNVLPVTDRALAWMGTAPDVPLNADGAITLLRWFWDNRPDAAAAFPGQFGTLLRPDMMFCDQLVAVFRTLLTVRGFHSRAVVFEYGDGHGGNAHTFAEIWVGKWLYADPFYGAYDSDDPVFLPSRIEQDRTMDWRKESVRNLFTDGARHRYVELANPLRRLEFISAAP